MILQLTHHELVNCQQLHACAASTLDCCEVCLAIIKKGEFLLDHMYITTSHDTTNSPNLIGSSTQNWEMSSTRDDINGIRSFSMMLRSTLVLRKSTKQSEFFCQFVHILQNTTIHLLLYWFIHTELGDVIHERRCRRDFTILEDVFVVPFVVQRTAWKHESLYMC
jgi:hypothetical protein